MSACFCVKDDSFVVDRLTYNMYVKFGLIDLMDFNLIVRNECQ